MGPIVSVLCSLLGKLFADEVKEWLPWLTERMIRAAVRILPANQRQRYREEWSSHLDEVPGKLAKLVVAAGFIKAGLAASPISSLPVRILFVVIAIWNLPALVVVATLVKLTSAGPVFCRQPEVCYGCGRTFKRLSFRTFYTDGPDLALRNALRGCQQDASTTPLGWLLIRSRLVALPYLAERMRHEVVLLFRSRK
jgi:Bacterial sugar transferase